MRPKSRNPFPLLIFAGVILLVSIVLFVLAATEGDSSDGFGYMVIGALIFIIAIACACLGLSLQMRYKRFKANLANPDSMASKLTSENSKYDFYEAVPDAGEQSTKRAITNIVGAASFIFLGAGLFSFGRKNTIDVFVSDEEVVLNQRENSAYDENKMIRLNADVIDKFFIATKGRYDRVLLSLKGGEIFELDISNARYKSDKIRASFDRLKIGCSCATTEENADVFLDFTV